MKTNLGSRFGNGISRVAAFALMAWLGLSGSAPADTLDLKNGTQVEGDILSENEQAILIEVQFDNATITSRRTYMKSDVAQIVRTPPETRKKEKMEMWYQRVMQYQLNPKTSYQTDYYDRVLKEVFQRYQEVFPESPHKKQIKELEAQWMAEREQVAAGKVKRDNQWMSEAEAEKQTENQKVLAILDTARSLVKSKEYRMAWLQLARALRKTHDPDIITQMREIGQDAYFKYVESLALKENWLKTQIDYQERRDARTNVAAANLEQQAAFAPGSKISVSGDDERVLRSAEVQGDAVRANAARSDQVLAEFRNKLAQVQQEIAELKQKKADWDAGMEVGGIKKSDVNP